MKKLGLFLLKNNIHLMTLVFLGFVMGVFAIWAVRKLGAEVDYPGIQWLWGALWFIGSFLLLEIWFRHIVGNKLTDMPKIIIPFIKKRLGKQ